MKSNEIHEIISRYIQECIQDFFLSIIIIELLLCWCDFLSITSENITEIPSGFSSKFLSQIPREILEFIQ